MQTKRFCRFLSVLLIAALLAITLFAAFALSVHSSPNCISDCGVCLHLAKLQTTLRQLVGAALYGTALLLVLLLLAMGAHLHLRYSTSLVGWKMRMNN
ncbi:MAG: hypothetical protein FWE28_03190 [Oscillospiraceae bacterium]|nr:hypothetical protein [Oscillospiraceae bacterium]